MRIVNAHNNSKAFNKARQGRATLKGGAPAASVM